MWMSCDEITIIATTTSTTPSTTNNNNCCNKNLTCYVQHKQQQLQLQQTSRLTCYVQYKQQLQLQQTSRLSCCCSCIVCNTISVRIVLCFETATTLIVMCHIVQHRSGTNSLSNRISIKILIKNTSHRICTSLLCHSNSETQITNTHLPMLKHPSVNPIHASVSIARSISSFSCAFVSPLGKHLS